MRIFTNITVYHYQYIGFKKLDYILILGIYSDCMIFGYPNILNSMVY